METDFFAYSRRKIEKDKEEGHFEAAHNRGMALRCFVNFLGKEELSLNELTPELMVKFEEWLNTKGRKQSTTRLYLYQIRSVYNIAVKEGLSDAAQDFVNFILSTEGQEVVADNKYIPLDDTQAYGSNGAGGQLLAFIVGTLQSLPILVPVLHMFWFFHAIKMRLSRKQRKRQKQFQSQMSAPRPGSGISMHKCAICGRTEITNPELEFRYCSKCVGNREYCQDHLFTHTHVK